MAYICVRRRLINVKATTTAHIAKVDTQTASERAITNTNIIYKTKLRK